VGGQEGSIVNADLIARGKAIGESGKHLPARGKWLGCLESWGLDVYEGSPQEWKDALAAEYFTDRRRGQQRRDRDGHQ
jgi:hypothetical protein